MDKLKTGTVSFTTYTCAHVHTSCVNCLLVYTRCWVLHTPAIVVGCVYTRTASLHTLCTGDAGVSHWRFAYVYIPVLMYPFKFVFHQVSVLTWLKAWLLCCHNGPTTGHHNVLASRLVSSCSLVMLMGVLLFQHTWYTQGHVGITGALLLRCKCHCRSVAYEDKQPRMLHLAANSFPQTM